MKKGGAIFILFIFLISLIPISIAQDTTVAKVLTDDQKETEELEKDRLKAVEDTPKPTLTATKVRAVLTITAKPAIAVNKEDLLKE
ncbi:MAG: hypothetical protein IIB81_01190, partial [Nanoarchaeota archaeon]|nr:hypothetical protein [Nanoarchaeota archaeon]